MSEKQFCARCEYYYSEMFTCPICYGAEQEVLRREAWLNRVRTMYEEKANIWYEGYEYATNDIIKLLEPFFDKAENAETRRLLIMAIALIKGENK